jgi:hypothetical protein
MRKEFTGADPFSNASDGDEAREDEWDDRLHPRHVNVALGQYLHLMDQLERKFAGTRPPQVPERMFVQTLAHYWTENLKLPIEISRRNRQVQGHFVEFVRAVLTLYPREQLKKVYPIERVVLGTLDGHILVVASAHELRPKTHR